MTVADHYQTPWATELIFYEPSIVALEIGAQFFFVGKRFEITEKRTGAHGLPAVVAEEVKQ